MDLVKMGEIAVSTITNTANAIKQEKNNKENKR